MAALIQSFRQMSKKLISRKKWKGYLRSRQIAELRKLRPARRVPALTRSEVLKKYYRELDVPSDFSLRENPNEVINFLNQIEELGRWNHVQLNFSAVNLITPEAIAALIATISKASLANTQVRGDIPISEQCKQILEESGFFDHVVHRRSLKAVGRGRIRRRQSKKVEPVFAFDLIAEGVQQAGKEHSEASYRILIEGMGNTLDHAKARIAQSKVFRSERQRARDLDSETWWAMAYVDSARGRVCFVFLDTGVGIFKSVKIKSIRKVSRALRLESNADLLRDVLTRKMSSRTGLSYRGKGLPAIHDLSVRQEVHSLTVISNDVIADITSNRFTLLEHAFNGTLLYWEI